MIENEDSLDESFEDPMIIDEERTIFVMLSQTNDHIYIITNPHEEINDIEIYYEQNRRIPKKFTESN